MMLNLPAGLPEGEMPRGAKAEVQTAPVHAGSSIAQVSNSAAADATDARGQPPTFAALLAGEDLSVELLAAMIAVDLPEAIQHEATDPEPLIAFLSGLESGKLLPPGGGVLPAASWNPAPVEDVAGEQTTSLARLLSMVRALHGAGSAVPGEAGGPGKLRPPFAGLELNELSRPAQATPPASAAAALSAPLPAMPSLAAAAPVPPSPPIAVIPGRSDWSEAVGQRVLWMVNNGRQVAEIRLNPPELGPVEVRVRANDDGLRLSFAAGNASVRDALEAAAPRLREMLLAEGLRLEDMDIGQRHAGAGQRGEVATPSAADDSGGPGGDTEPGGASVASRTRVGLVDLFV